MVRRARPSPDAARARMVERHLARRGIRDPSVLGAMGRLPRERFVPAALADRAYDDAPLPIGAGQTISQPYVVALMVEAAEVISTDRVLEVGTGSGYGAAVLAAVAAEVWTIDRLGALVEQARQTLAELGIENVHAVMGDGSVGLPDHAPFDAIVVTAGGPEVPPGLVDQLAPGGRLVMPVGEPADQQLVRVRRRAAGTSVDRLGSVRFVPLIGAAAWPDEAPPTRPH